MNPSDDTPDRELLDRYRRASDAESLAPRDAVRTAILEEGRRAAASFSTSETERHRPSRWKLTAFATAATVLLATLVIAPKLLESERQGDGASSATNSFKQAAVKKAEIDVPSSAPSPPVPVMPVQNEPVPRPKLQSVKPLAAPEARQRSVDVPPPPPIHYPEQSVEVSALNQGQSANPSRSAASQLSGSNLASFSRRASDAAAPAAALPKATQMLDERAASAEESAVAGRTPLMFAVEQGRLDAVRQLLKGGADPNAADPSGMTPLKLAQQKGLIEIADVLKQAGAK